MSVKTSNGQIFALTQYSSFGSCVYGSDPRLRRRYVPARPTTSRLYSNPNTGVEDGASVPSDTGEERPLCSADRLWGVGGRVEEWDQRMGFLPSL